MVCVKYFHEQTNTYLMKFGFIIILFVNIHNTYDVENTFKLRVF